MTTLSLLLVGLFSLGIGSILGYLARQSIAKRDYATIEAKIQKRITQAKEETDEIISQAKEKGQKIIDRSQKEVDQRRQEIFRTEKLLLKRENILEERITDQETKQKDFLQKVEKLKEIKVNLENLQKEAQLKLEQISGLTKEEAKKEYLDSLESEYSKDFLDKTRKLEQEGQERFKNRAKEILTLAIQKCSVSQVQETTTTIVSLPSEEIKGRIIGKEGRNIRTLEQLTGVEIVIDETPEIVVITAFDPVRRQIAKVALEKLIQDGRIQPARIEEAVQKAETEINTKIKEAGEQAVYDVGIYGLNPKLIQLLGRLKFRTSYGQNVLLHSIEVAHMAQALAYEIGGNPKVALKAGFLHDIGKAVDHQIQGSHTDIGIKIMEKFEVEKEVITAVKAHHEEYPYESLEAVIIQTADAISGSRPGARKDTLENYLKRLEELEKIALNFPGVKKAWALQAGREIRIFVKPEEIDDFQAKKMAREVANRIEDELKYPGEIKVNVIRESRVTEYAK
jgi:ribonuclease Y